MQLFKRATLLFFLPGAIVTGFAQTTGQSKVTQFTDSLNVLGHLMQRGENDSVRMASCEAYKSILDYILADSSSFDVSFDSIPNLSVKGPPDRAFRIYTWMTAKYDGSAYTYFGFLQLLNPKTKKIFLIPLTDSTDVIEKPLVKKLKPSFWYGAIYYNVIANTHAGKKFYTLLGWKGKNETLTQKVIDVLTFENGKPYFGFPVLQAKKNIYHRVLFEFTSQATMSLKYVKEKNVLVFDHIGRSPITSMVGPDGTYDAFRFVKDHWELAEDVDVDNGFVPRKKEVPLFKDDDLKKEPVEK